jgi:hypothetical protein
MHPFFLHYYKTYHCKHLITTSLNETGGDSLPLPGSNGTGGDSGHHCRVVMQLAPIFFVGVRYSSERRRITTAQVSEGEASEVNSAKDSGTKSKHEQ